MRFLKVLSKVDNFYAKTQLSTESCVLTHKSCKTAKKSTRKRAQRATDGWPERASGGHFLTALCKTARGGPIGPPEPIKRRQIRP